MSEHFLGSNKGFEILAKSGQNPLLSMCIEAIFEFLQESESFLVDCGNVTSFYERARDS
jgi:hypothetical protein